MLAHPRYLRPATAPHFLWRDLYEPLAAGEQPISAWLREGFEKLGFTPALPHIGELWPDDSEEVKENQCNFAKLWQSTTSYLSDRFQIESASRCEVYFTPKAPALVNYVWVTPVSQQGTLLRTRACTSDTSREEVRRRLEAAVPSLPVQPDLSEVRLPSGQLGIDLVVSLRLVLGGEADAAAQEARLFAQVVPVVEALIADA